VGILYNFSQKFRGKIKSGLVALVGKHERDRNVATIRLHTTHKNALPCRICKAVRVLLFSHLGYAATK